MKISAKFKSFIYQIDKSNTIINDKHYNELDEKGFTILKSDKTYWKNNHLDFDLMEKELDHLCDKEGIEGGWENNKKKGSFWEPSAQRVSNLPNKNPIFINLAMLPDIILAVNYVIKKPFKFSSMQIRNPLPYGDQQSLHIDFRPRQFDYFNYNQCSAFVYFDDANIENGAIKIYPKTHKLLGEPSQEFIDLNKLKPISIEVKKYNILLLNVYAWHFAGKNINGKKRRTIFVNYRERSELQQLDQKRFLCEGVIEKLTDNEKYLFAVRKEDPLQSVFMQNHRNNFLVKKYMKFRDIFYHKYLQFIK